MKTIAIKYPGKKCIIFVGGKLNQTLLRTVSKISRGSLCAVISDSNLARLYSKELLSLLSKSSIKNTIAVFKAGERSKTRRTKELLEDKILSAGADRNSLILALGGGVTGDIAGFTAATFMRGIRYIQMPTSLVAMVDSSIGGKTGVDTAKGKNLIGAFWQPEFVFIDINYIQTLPYIEYHHGLSEVIKYALIRDKGLLKYLETNSAAVLAREPHAVEKIVTESVLSKKYAVENDEREAGLRRTLNAGHTAGHAVELAADYKLGHGFCVAVGLAVEAEIAFQNKFLTAAEKERCINLLKLYRLPVRIPSGMKAADLLKAMQLDKKNASGKIRMSLLEKCGLSRENGGAWVDAVEPKVILSALKSCGAK